MALSANERLILVRVKIQRANKHLCNLESSLIPYSGIRRTAYIKPLDRKPGTPPVIAMDLPVIPFDALAAAGDVIQNLRSALDHLTFQLFTVGSPGKGPTTGLCFPISKSVDTYEAEKGRKLQGLREDAREAIDALKPYKGGNDTLWLLHKLNNIDKHNFLLTEGQDVLCEGDFDTPSADHPYYWLKSGDPNFIGIFGDETDRNLQSAENVLDDTGVLRVNAMLPTLRHLVASIDDLAKSFLPTLE